MHYLPFYTGDYLKHTRHLSMAEHGAYFLLITYCWDMEGPAPLDERKLFGICNARSADEMEAVRRVLNEFFVKMEDGWYNKRVMQEIDKAKTRYQQAVEAGKASARKRVKEKCGLASNGRSTDVEQTFNQPEPKPEPEPDPELDLEKEEEVRKKPARTQRTPTPTRQGENNKKIPYSAIVQLYHQKLPMLTPIEELTNYEKAQIRERWVSGELPDLDTWAEYFDCIAQSPFLTGRKSRNGEPFRPDIGWLTTRDNYIKLTRGKYHER